MTRRLFCFALIAAAALPASASAQRSPRPAPTPLVRMIPPDAEWGAVADLDALREDIAVMLLLVQESQRRSVLKRIEFAAGVQFEHVSGLAAFAVPTRPGAGSAAAADGESPEMIAIIRTCRPAVVSRFTGGPNRVKLLADGFTVVVRLGGPEEPGTAFAEIEKARHTLQPGTPQAALAESQALIWAGPKQLNRLAPEAADANSPFVALRPLLLKTDGAAVGLTVDRFGDTSVRLLADANSPIDAIAVRNSAQSGLKFAQLLVESAEELAEKNPHQALIWNVAETLLADSFEDEPRAIARGRRVSAELTIGSGRTAELLGVLNDAEKAEKAEEPAD
ncbi:MAG: hypothetical protein AAF907_03295 [Planctomycetota bacterium]